MKKNHTIFTVFLLSIFTLFIGCKKDLETPIPPPPPVKQMLTHTLNAESIIAPGGSIAQSNLTFLNLYEGIAYAKVDADFNSSKVDFSYNYKGAGCTTCRFFENVTNMSTRTNYVHSFSTLTNSKIRNVEQHNAISLVDFDALKNGTEIENLFNSKLDIASFTGIADITDRVTDVSQGRVFAFIDKSGRKGFFKIADYLANVPSGDKATLQLTVKIVKD